MGQIGYIFNLIFGFPMFNALMLLDHLFGDFGLSIIVLTVLIRLVLFPLTLKQLRSTKATQALQPLLADIKKKYPKDQRAQYAETQRLYKEYNVSPLAGCLPLVIQLPIIYGLYDAMDIVLRHTGPVTAQFVNSYIYPFLPMFAHTPSFFLNWFIFISPAAHISLALPDPTHILPVLAGLATFAQLRMSQPRNQQQSAGSSNMMTNQMQIMSLIMPFVTFFIALSFPAGLALYWTTTSVFSMVQQYFVTGWGSLFTMPNLSALGLGGGSKNTTNAKGSYVEKPRNDDMPREKARQDNVVEADEEISGERVTRSYSNSNSAATRSNRARRPNSSSARRRGNAPRRNASRS